MKQYLFAAWLMVCVGCGGESRTSGPSPLETFDQDRLWVLINAAVNRGRGAECARYFQAADNPEGSDPTAEFIRAALSKVCPASVVKIADYLEHNGVVGVKPAHVKDLAFWERMEVKAGEAAKRKQAVAEDIRQCRQQVAEDERNNIKSPGLLHRDFPNAQAYRAAWDEAQARKQEQEQEYNAAWRACGSIRNGTPTRADLGISFPEGMRVGMLGRIN